VLSIAELVQLIKKAACDAVEATKPMQFVYGKVISINPLKVSIDQKVILTSGFLVVPKHLTDYKMTVEFSGAETTHTFKNALKTDDKVVLLQQKGGQQYLILDRVVDS
jgi:hypothetical protein